MPIPKGYKFDKIHKWTEEEKEYLKEICLGKSYIEIIELKDEGLVEDNKAIELEGEKIKKHISLPFTVNYMLRILLNETELRGRIS